MIPYGKQIIDEDDIRAVCEVLRSDFLTTGPLVQHFEKAVTEYTGARFGVAVNSGTAALHCAMYALDIGAGDEVIVPPLTFAATANAVYYQGATPVFADVDAASLLLDPAKIEEKITAKTKAIIGVDYAGMPCDWDRLRTIADTHGLSLVADGCHALGAHYKSRPVGTLADITVFSFHPVKHITTGEGGMLMTNNQDFARKAKKFRNHGIDADATQRARTNSWFYTIEEPGFNYRLSDIQCALGVSQLKKLPAWLAKRRALAARYDEIFNGHQHITPVSLAVSGTGFSYDFTHAFHLYVVRVSGPGLRDSLFARLRKKDIGVAVHYPPVHLHPFYQKHYGCKAGDCPIAERASEEILSLPLWPGLLEDELSFVADEINAFFTGNHP